MSARYCMELGVEFYIEYSKKTRKRRKLGRKNSDRRTLPDQTRVNKEVYRYAETGVRTGRRIIGRKSRNTEFYEVTIYCFLRNTERERPDYLIDLFCNTTLLLEQVPDAIRNII